MAILFVDKTKYVNIVDNSTSPNTPLLSVPKNRVCLNVTNASTGEITLNLTEYRFFGFFRTDLDASQQGTSLLNCVDTLQGILTV